MSHIFSAISNCFNESIKANFFFKANVCILNGEGRIGLINLNVHKLFKLFKRCWFPSTMTSLHIHFNWSLVGIFARFQNISITYHL